MSISFVANKGRTKMLMYCNYKYIYINIQPQSFQAFINKFDIISNIYCFNDTHVPMGLME